MALLLSLSWSSSSRLIFAPPDKVDLVWSTLASGYHPKYLSLYYTHSLPHCYTASLVEGPLASTCATLAKVSTSPKDESQNYQHVMCLYVPDVYDKDKIIEVKVLRMPVGDLATLTSFQVMRVLLRNHGLNLMGVKSNLYTAIGKYASVGSCVHLSHQRLMTGPMLWPGLDSKHPSGIQSTVRLTIVL